MVSVYRMLIKNELAARLVRCAVPTRWNHPSYSLNCVGIHNGRRAPLNAKLIWVDQTPEAPNVGRESTHERVFS